MKLFKSLRWYDIGVVTVLLYSAFPTPGLAHGGGRGHSPGHHSAHISGGGFHYGMKGGRRNPDRNLSPIRTMKKYGSYQRRQRSLYHSWVKYHTTHK